MITTVTYGVSITMIKLALLIMYRRIFENTPRFKTTTRIVGLACVAW